MANDTSQVQASNRRQTSAEGANITVDGLTKVYNEGEADEVIAIEDIDLEIEPNEFVSIIGPSGCGKTTLLKCIGDLVEPTVGEVQINGEPATAARKERELAFYFQEDVLLPWRSVIDNVLLPLQIEGKDIDKEQFREEAREVLTQVGLDGFEHSMPAELSGGMRQRVALARGFIFDPMTFLMDEPFAALDELTRRKMNKRLLDIHQSVQKTTVFVTHHIAEAVWLSDKVVILNSHPGEVDEIVDIDIPRPRDENTRQSEAFHEYEDALTDKIIEFDV
ncbi:ABC transporter ATP-binding protein [Haloarcula sp. GH36]|uniref:ABC transporter ATP-binding protein n=1 Tax=Haloarcula montana TaxID=3111776 RepID=UPI002D78D410|nr:ABC transporter ATP-binding protein [Haloarcula sp. GH36]